MFLYYCSSYLSKSGQMKSFPKSDPGMFDPLPSLPAPALVLPPTSSPSSSWTTSPSPCPHTLDPHPIHPSVLHPPPYVLPQQPVVYVPSFGIRLVVRELPSANVVQRRYDLVVLTACTSILLNTSSSERGTDGWSYYPGGDTTQAGHDDGHGGRGP